MVVLHHKHFAKGITDRMQSSYLLSHYVIVSFKTWLYHNVIMKVSRPFNHLSMLTYIYLNEDM